MRRAFLCVLLTLAAAACSRIPPDPLLLDGGILRVSNQTDADWTRVEIWINRYYRTTTARIAHGSRFEVAVGLFVDGYGRTFDRSRAMITDLRLTAVTPDGVPVSVQKVFETSGLSALKGRR